MTTYFNFWRLKIFRYHNDNELIKNKLNILEICKNEKYNIVMTISDKYVYNNIYSLYLLNFRNFIATNFNTIYNNYHLFVILIGLICIITDIIIIIISIHFSEYSWVPYITIISFIIPLIYTGDMFIFNCYHIYYKWYHIEYKEHVKNRYVDCSGHNTESESEEKIRMSEINYLENDIFVNIIKNYGNICQIQGYLNTNKKISNTFPDSIVFNNKSTFSYTFYIRNKDHENIKYLYIDTDNINKELFIINNVTIP